MFHRHEPRTVPACELYLLVRCGEGVSEVLLHRQWLPECPDPYDGGADASKEHLLPER